MNLKSLLTVLFVLAAMLSLSNNNVFAQDLPYFNVKVEDNGCFNAVNNAFVEIYYAGGSLITQGYTSQDGWVALGGSMPGECPYNVDIKVYYEDQYGEKLNVTRSCSGNNETVCLRQPDK